MLVISQPLSSVWSLDKIPKKTIKLLVGKKNKNKNKKPPNEAEYEETVVH